MISEDFHDIGQLLLHNDYCLQQKLGNINYCQGKYHG